MLGFRVSWPPSKWQISWDFTGSCGKHFQRQRNQVKWPIRIGRKQRTNQRPFLINMYQSEISLAKGQLEVKILSCKDKSPVSAYHVDSEDASHTSCNFTTKDWNWRLKRLKLPEVYVTFSSAIHLDIVQQGFSISATLRGVDFNFQNSHWSEEFWEMRFIRLRVAKVEKVCSVPQNISTLYQSLNPGKEKKPLGQKLTFSSLTISWKANKDSPLPFLSQLVCAVRALSFCSLTIRKYFVGLFFVCCGHSVHGSINGYY